MIQLMERNETTQRDHVEWDVQMAVECCSEYTVRKQTRQLCLLDVVSWPYYLSTAVFLQVVIKRGVSIFGRHRFLYKGYTLWRETYSGGSYVENWGHVFQSTLKHRNITEFLCADVGLGSISTERQWLW